MVANRDSKIDTSIYQFPEIDRSYWKTGDKAWMAERKSQWPRIEEMLRSKKSSRAITIIKQYFLQGKLPDWDKLRDWANRSRHLDLLLFLWMHPNQDKAFLKQTRDQYAKSVVVTREDIGVGYGLLFGAGIVYACQENLDSEHNELDLPSNVFYSGNNEFYFDVMMEDVEYLDRELEFIYMEGYAPEKSVVGVPTASFDYISQMSRWLCIKHMRTLNRDMLFQYDRPLEWWYRCRTRDENYFENRAQAETMRQNYRKYLYRIHYFDTDKEGDTCRTRFVQKMSKMLDEREFISEFKQMWEDVKAGNVEVKKPWAMH